MYKIKKYSWISPYKSTWRFLIFASISADFMSFPILSGFNSQISDFGVTFQWFFFPTQLAKKDLDLLNKHIAGEIVLEGNDFIAGDTTGDGVINAADKALLEERISGVIKPFPNKGIPKKDQRLGL